MSTFAAVILISGLATSSLTQAAISVVSSPERKVQDAVARKVMSPYRSYDDLQEAAFSTLLMPQKNRRDLLYQQIEPRCPIGDCRWDQFNSLGICAVTRNITDGLEIRIVDHDEAQQMDEFSEFNTDDEEAITYYNLTSKESWRADCAVFDTDLNIMGFLAACTGLVVGSPRGTSIPPMAVLTQSFFIYKSFAGGEIFSGDLSYRALEVTWYWCVQKYDVGVSAGIPRTNIVEETLEVVVENDLDMTITSADQQEKFDVSSGGPLMIQGNWTDIHTNILLSAVDRRIFWESGGGIEAHVTDQFERLNNLAANMALGMTN